MAFYMMNSVMVFRSICFWSYNSILICLLNAWSFLLKEEFQPQPLLLLLKLDHSKKKKKKNNFYRAIWIKLQKKLFL